MKKPFYLSLDIDFWNRVPAETVVEYLDAVTKYAQDKGIRVRGYMNHHHMLDAVSKCPVKVLVNVDEHSDLSDTDCNELNCGTWVGYVPWRKKGTYIWYHSLSANTGDCTGGAGIPIFGCNEVRLRANLSDWKKIKHQRVINANFNPVIFMENCIEVGICMSPYYANVYLHPVFHTWRKKHHIPYKWGRKEENQAVQKKPS